MPVNTPQQEKSASSAQLTTPLQGTNLNTLDSYILLRLMAFLDAPTLIQLERVARVFHDISKTSNEFTLRKQNYQKQLEWDKLIQTNASDPRLDDRNILFPLSRLLKEGYIPANPNPIVIMHRYMPEKRMSLIDAFIEAGYYQSADKLLSLGVTFSTPPEPVEDTLESWTNLFEGLCGVQLYKLSRTDPTFFQRRGINNEGALHHLAAHDESYRDSLPAVIDAANLDLFIIDNRARTPLHIAASSRAERTYTSVLPTLIEKAVAQANFNFNLLDAEGRGIIHYFMISDAQSPFCRLGSGALLEQAFDRTDVNLFTRTGSTAFFYAANRMDIKSAALLIAAGADPFLTGNPTRNAMTEIANAQQNLERILCDLLAIDLSQPAKSIYEAILAVYREHCPQEDLSDLISEYSNVLDSYQSRVGHVQDPLNELLALNEMVQNRNTIALGRWDARAEKMIAIEKKWKEISTKQDEAIQQKIDARKKGLDPEALEKMMPCHFKSSLLVRNFHAYLAEHMDLEMDEDEQERNNNRRAPSFFD